MTVVGLKIVGLVMIVALLINPPVIAGFMDRPQRADDLGARARRGLLGYLGAAISASGAGLPTGPIIVLVASALFFPVRCSSRTARGVVRP